MTNAKRIDITIWPETQEVSVHRHLTEVGSDEPAPLPVFVRVDDNDHLMELVNDGTDLYVKRED